MRLSLLRCLQVRQRHSTVHQATRPNENESFFVIVDRPADHPEVLAYFHSLNPYRMIEVLPACTAADRAAKYAPALYADLVLEFFRANYAHQQGHGTAAMPNRYA